MLEVQGLSAWWGNAQALFGVSLQVPAGELVVLRGLNGAGKSTLLQSLAGVGPRTSGRMVFGDHALHTMPAHARAQTGLSWVPEQRRLFGGLSVAENLSLAARIPVQQGLEDVLTLFPALKPALRRSAAQLSGGEQQMLALARALMTDPQLLLLDEPCEGIAPLLVESIRDALLVLKRRGLTLLVAEQNTVLADYADQCITLAGGQILKA